MSNSIYFFVMVYFYIGDLQYIMYINYVFYIFFINNEICMNFNFNYV